MVCGYLLGRLSKRVINRIDLTNDALYSVLLISVMLFIFGFTTWIGGNGYLAVYIGGLFLGNSRFVHKRSSMKFFDGLTWLFQIIMFLSLGLLVNPSELLPVAGIGVLVGLFMIFVSRPLSVLLSMLPFRKFSLNGRIFTSFVGLRGAVPIIFATYPMIAGVENANTMFNIVFFITILSLVFQGTMIPQVARWFKLDLPMKEKVKLKEFDVEFSDDIKSAMSEMQVTSKMVAKGDRLMDITIPDHTLVAMVKRGEKYFIPRGNTHLMIGDKILIITDNEKAMQEVKDIWIE
jgi:cell volume regulation protein A